MMIAWMFTCNHQMLQQRNKYPSSKTFGAKCYGLFRINYNLYMDIKGVKLKFKKDRLKILVEQSILEKLTYNMKPPHCRTRKCQELNQLLSSWMVTLLAIPNKYHQYQMVAYQRSISSKDMAFCTYNKGLCSYHGTLVQSIV